MQKIINLLAILSFGVSVSVVGGATYLYLNKDTLIDGVKEKIKESVMGAVTGSLPGMVDTAIPELPSTTGGIIPSSKGGSSLPIPSFK